ncbi:MAG: GNAT family N-acetyltransferase [Chloroflexota bacterium]
MTTQPILRDLGDGLILRRATSADADALADFNGGIHGEDPADEVRVAAWTRDLLTRPHPTLTPGDFTLVEEAATGRIVSSMNLIPQTWTYEGIPFGVGRPELVGTLPEFRKRGLVRIQFEVIHQWCVERNLPVQAITGIPYFYRQFGYEMALDFVGRRFGHEANVPRLKKGEKEKYRIRPATKRDLSFIAKVYAGTQKRYMLSCVRGVDVFAYELEGQSRKNVNRFELRVIEDARGRRLGYFQHSSFLGMTGLTALGCELAPGVSWLDVTPCVARYLWKTGGKYAKRDKRTRTSFGFMLGAQHPSYDALGDALPSVREPYAWFLRVPDLAGFIRHIAPVLEKRLAESIAVGYSGELLLSFYRGGLRLVFARGRLKKVGTWKPKITDEPHANFPDLTFLQLLFGYRSFAELEFGFADCTCMNNSSRVLLDILFPKRLSDVFPIF